MMRQEFESLVGRSVSENEWEVVERIYAFHPDVPEVGGKDVVARWYQEAMSNPYPSFQRLVYDKLGAANDEAATQGASRVRYVIPAWYGVDVVDEAKGTILETRMKSVAEVYRYCLDGLGDMVDEYFSVMPDSNGQRNERRPWPNWKDGVRWIAVFPVTGGSEGHYVHVEAMFNDGKRELLLLGKTFRGMEHAWDMCKRLGELLDV